MKLYLVGPPLDHKAFNAATAQLRVIGYDVEIQASDAYVSGCDGVATIDGWAEGGWAVNKVNIAIDLGLPVRPVGDWIFDADMENRSLTVEASDG